MIELTIKNTHQNNMKNALRDAKTGRYLSPVAQLKGTVIACLIVILTALGAYHIQIARAGIESELSTSNPQTVDIPYSFTTQDGKPCDRKDGAWTCFIGQTQSIVKPVTVLEKKVSQPKGGKKLTSAQSSIATKILAIAETQDFDRLSYLLALADCESSFDPARSNTKGNNPSWSKDRGLFMYNNHWQNDVSDKCAYDLECATKEAIKDIKAGHQGQWVCDGIIKGENRIGWYTPFVQAYLSK